MKTKLNVVRKMVEAFGFDPKSRWAPSPSALLAWWAAAPAVFRRLDRLEKQVKALKPPKRKKTHQYGCRKDGDVYRRGEKCKKCDDLRRRG
jgi:hypothetical protein